MNEIRPARAEDADDIARVHVASWRVAYDGLMPAAYLQGLDVGARAAGWRSTLAAPKDRSRTLVLESDGELVGFVAVGASRDEPESRQLSGEVAAIYLDPACWGRGWGRALLGAGRCSLVEMGFGDAVLWVLDANARARAFYKADGWALDGGVKTDESRGFTVREVRYRRALR